MWERFQQIEFKSKWKVKPLYVILLAMMSVLPGELPRTGQKGNETIKQTTRLNSNPEQLPEDIPELDDVDEELKQLLEQVEAIISDSQLSDDQKADKINQLVQRLYKKYEILEFGYTLRLIIILFLILFLWFKNRELKKMKSINNSLFKTMQKIKSGDANIVDVILLKGDEMNILELLKLHSILPEGTEKEGIARMIEKKLDNRKN